MPNCEYVDQKRSGPNGWYCTIIGHINDPTLRENYCKFSTRCVHCPKRGGDDRYRKVQNQEPERPKNPAPVYHQRETVDTPVGRGGSSGGGGSSYSLMDGIGSIARTLGLTLILSLVICGALLVFHVFGITGPWVDMQLPTGISVGDASLYTVCRESDKMFKLHKTEFEEDGSVHAVTQIGYNDVYFQRDGASVWLGTCHVLHLNTAVVYDTTYEEICQQLYRTLLVELKDTAGAPITSALTVTDDASAPQRCVPLGENLYLVVMPDSPVEPVLTFQVQGFEAYTAQIDLSGRLARVVVTLCGEGEGQ